MFIRDNDNKRPKLTIPQDTCIIAGDAIVDFISSSDPDNHLISLTRENNGGIFNLFPPRNSATFRQTQNDPGVASGIFSWTTVCQDIRREPYQVVFKASDMPMPEEDRLVDIKTWHIKVVGPPPKLNSATADPSAGNIELEWDLYTCQNAESITIFRRIGNLDHSPNACAIDFLVIWDIKN